MVQQQAPTPLKNVKDWAPGMPEVSSSDMNAVFDAVKRHDLAAIRDLEASAIVPGKITCCGPRGAVLDPQREDETYWVAISSHCSNDGLTADEPIEYEVVPETYPVGLDPDEGDNPEYGVMLATNKAELMQHTHYLPDGQDVELRFTYDEGTPPRIRWYFTLMPLAILVCLAGSHNAVGSIPALGMATLFAGKWTEDFHHQPSTDIVATHLGFVEFQGEWYTVGDFILDFGLPSQFGSRVMKWNPATTKWETVGTAGTTILATGYMGCLVWDDGTGERLVVYGTSSAGNDIWTFNGSTWAALPSQCAGLANKLIVWDDGTGGGDELYAGLNLTTPGMQKLSTFAGTWANLPTLPGYFTNTPSVYDLKVWDDESGVGKRLWITGHFGDSTSTSPLRNVCKFDPVGVAYEPAGFFGGTADYGTALELYDDSTGKTMYLGMVLSGSISPLWSWTSNGWIPRATNLRDVMGGGRAGHVAALKVHEGKLLIGGFFHVRRHPVGLGALGQLARLDRTEPEFVGHGEGFSQ